ncbi:DUF4041 domain-containing protein [Streptococcus sp. 21WXBC0057M1]|jgi:hypothetical protein|uniref:DUF4041 domain-containing protein n=1 Tax=Streptococcus wuxiensis TaxID=3095078 RepID=A0ABU5FR73_9STRE|nr:DUF4041 domain-containing protein [Streptococcus sp. 21WXBC0057M1]MDY4337349.1 DUF4041 domain-containing protein [Streptococcus sp. 21WXBC0057M1]
MGLFNFGKPKDEILEAKLQKLTDDIEIKKVDLAKLEQQIKKGKEVISLDTELAQKRNELAQLNEEIAVANGNLNLQEFGFFERQYSFSDSTKYKDKLDSLRMQQKSMVKNGTAGRIITPMLLDNSKSKGKAMQNQLIKAALRGFNGEADALLVKISVVNVDNKIKALRKVFEQLNKMYARNLIEITYPYLDLKIEELRLAAEYELQKQEEKELLREQREKEREDKKLQAEIKAKRKQLEKDRDHFKNMVAKVTELLKEAKNDEVDELKRQLAEYQDKLSELDEIEEDIDYREGHATAGYVYVISNIGSFGEDVYKIGVTRRLEPLERIRELSSASVPFQFDVHALIFSEEAFALETELHNQLANYKVNKVNGRKEYFKVSFEEIRNILATHKELTVELNEDAEAFEYRQTKAIEDKQL